MVLVGIIIIAVVAKIISLIKTMIVTKADCSTSVIIEFVILIPALIALMFVELVLYAIRD